VVRGKPWFWASRNSFWGRW